MRPSSLKEKQLPDFKLVFIISIVLMWHLSHVLIEFKLPVFVSETIKWMDSFWLSSFSASCNINISNNLRSHFASSWHIPLASLKPSQQFLTNHGGLLSWKSPWLVKPRPFTKLECLYRLAPSRCLSLCVEAPDFFPCDFVTADTLCFLRSSTWLLDII
jgi:hypothetical protein